MSTHSLIAKKVGERKYRWIYCQFDGYPSHNGKILVEHYGDPLKIDRLLELGDLATLGPEIGEKHEYAKRERAHCTAYSRDCGEDWEDVKPKEGRLADLIRAKEEYVYVFSDGRWTIYDPSRNWGDDEFAPVEEALKKEE